MNCDFIKEELFDYLGFDKLPINIEKHLKECSDCRNFWVELNGLSNQLGSDEEFYPDNSILENFVSDVNAQIDNLEIDKNETSTKLINYLLPIAASILILLGISLSSNYLNSPDYNLTNNFNGDLYFQFGYYIDEEDDEMDIQFVDELLNDYSVSVINAQSEQLLDDLTDEEMEYLKTNFNAGDILL